MENYICKWMNTDPKHKSFNIDIETESPSMVLDSDGNIYTTYPFVYGNTICGDSNKGIAVMKMDPNGQVLWLTQSPFFNTEGGVSVEPKIAIDSQSNIYVVYQTNSALRGFMKTGSNDVIVFSLNPNGCDRWIRQGGRILTIDGKFVEDQTDTDHHIIDFNGSGFNSFPDITIGTDNTLFITLTTSSVKLNEHHPDKKSDIVVVSMNSDGKIIWIRQENKFNQGSLENRLSKITAYDDHCIVVFDAQFDPTFNTVMVFALNTYGHFKWIRQISSTKSIFSQDITSSYGALMPMTSNPNLLNSPAYIFITYHGLVHKRSESNTFTSDQHQASSKVFVTKIDVLGMIMWTSQINSSNYSSSIAVNRRGNCYVASLNITNAMHINLTKLRSDGSVEWSLKPFVSSLSQPFPVVSVDFNQDVVMTFSSNQDKTLSPKFLEQLNHTFDFFTGYSDADKDRLHQMLVTIGSNWNIPDQYLLYNLLNDFVIRSNNYLLQHPETALYDPLVVLVNKITGGFYYVPDTVQHITVCKFSNAMNIVFNPKDTIDVVVKNILLKTLIIR